MVLECVEDVAPVYILCELVSEGKGWRVGWCGLLTFHIFLVMRATSVESERWYAKASIPHSERQIQIGISTTRAIAQDMNAGRVISVAREWLVRLVATAQIGNPYQKDPVRKLSAFSNHHLHALAIRPNCGRRTLV